MIERSAGILMPISSLPSPYGIGTLGEQAYKFVDFLVSGKQRFWQILPLNPLGEGNSPYKSISCFAGEMLYIDIDFLVRDGFLNQEDIGEYEFAQNVDYKAVRHFKLPLLAKAAKKFDLKHNGYQHFARENSWWLDSYALFAAALSAYNTKKLTELPDGIKYRIPEALKKHVTKQYGKWL